MRKCALLTLACLLKAACSSAAAQNLPEFEYDVARTHELKPHRRTIPLTGVSHGFNQLHLTLTISPAGDVVQAEVAQNDELMKFWLKVKPEVLRWKFTPFEENGKAVTAEVEEYIDLVPPERLPTRHVAAPPIRPNSHITITLARSGCYGSCPSYCVSVSTDGITFDGRRFVAASGKHTDSVSPDAVRSLAQRFIAGDFYSMKASYRAFVTDNPTYVLTITIDGRTKAVEDYVGEWVGMPAVISDLEGEVDNLAGTGRWIKGDDGLVAALQAEHFNFQTYEAQAMLRAALRHGKSATARELLKAGVPLQPLPPSPAALESDRFAANQPVGWLFEASDYPEMLQILMGAGVNQHDQNDKDLALGGAARSGKLEAVRALIAYGANPTADLNQAIFTRANGESNRGEGSSLIHAVRSGNIEVVREILRYHPALEVRTSPGITAMFAPGDIYSYGKEGARVECVRLLAQAGANVNARDNEGNTPLHKSFRVGVARELLKLGADVNARNNDGETPIFTTHDDDSIQLLIAHGADLTARNKKGQTIVEAAKEEGPAREKALKKAIQDSRQR
jgi:uncharacterized protein DUF6438/ankyrin repeat protein